MTFKYIYRKHMSLFCVYVIVYCVVFLFISISIGLFVNVVSRKFDPCGLNKNKFMLEKGKIR